MSPNLTSDRSTEGTHVPCSVFFGFASFVLFCLLCLCFPTDRVASGAKRRSPTSACGSRG